MNEEKHTYYITTPIYYPSDKLHIGHAYSTTIADTIARYKRLQGFDVFFLTGSDEHGQKIEKKAHANNETPLAYVDKIVATFQNLWQKLNISHDDFIRTTEERHQKVVQEILRRIYQKGDIYKGIYSGWYCTPCESYFTERQVTKDHICPDCKRKVEKIEEEAYFFRLSKYASKLVQYIEQHPQFIEPVARKNEMLNFIRQGLEDLCITRTSFSWGIPLPTEIDNAKDGKKHVVYVWFDALTNYLTPIGFLDDKDKFNRYWPCDLHLVGKEIVRFHTIIWPAILMALDLELPKKIYGHGWLITDGEKMSKSKGNVVDPLELIEEFGEEPLKYFLLREIQLGQDGNFSRTALIKRFNADLSNDLGNLLYRTLSMLEKYQDGIILEVKTKDTYSDNIKAQALHTVKIYEEKMDNLEINTALKELFSFISSVNKYIDQTEPWKLFKEKKLDQLQTVLYTLAESLRIIAILLTPVMVKNATKILNQLGLKDLPLTFDAAKTWGALPTPLKIQKEKPLFPRIEEEK